ncbi:DUF4231 domain-containing protein [Kineosporia sp. NBRC 101731]|uniref:DUF4231 domain-containing protein n=1 Tax=Kineosporia sp. NBRC 101731 TaxID=3032199 RepID=UPI0024A2EEF1|nr:DUF4231 domain-containing protein [Kineosporia sp. NBRC 101731]GLY30337.1 hypothetical protein Kisp02_37020 [Kineosporia sp. NBRC 101731]
MDGASYAAALADESYERYRRHADRSRNRYRLTEILFVVLSAAIPVAAVIVPGVPVVPAVLGACLVLLTGLRNLFQWHENYVRFSRAREAVNAERRLYAIGSAPYDYDSSRDRLLVETINRIEQEEMGQWVRVITQRAPDPVRDTPS